MLSTQPQPVLKVFFNSLKTSKKIFIPILSVSFIWAFVNTTFYSLSDMFSDAADKALLYLSCFALLFLINTFCSYWCTYFIYTKLTNHITNLTETMGIAAKRFFHVLALVFISTVVCIAAAAVLILAMMLFGKIAEHFSHTNEILASIIFYTPLTSMLIFATIASIIFWVFFIVAKMEILLKNTKIFPAIKKAANISLKTSNIWKILVFFIMTTFLVLIVLSPNLISIWLPTWIHSKVLINIINFAVLFITTLVYLPFYITACICFYNDLILRYESQLK